MYFSKLLLKDFGKFHNREINLQPGVNVAYGTRNAGKSTVADFEYAMKVQYTEDEVVEMDTVKGVREQGKRLLTMIFRKNKLPAEIFDSEQH